MERGAALTTEGFEAILVGARAGEDAAVRALYHDLQPRLSRFFRAAEPRVADDLAAEVWVAVAAGLARFEGGHRELLAWVFTIARRRLADHRRTAARRRTEVTDPGELGELGDATASVETEHAAMARMSGDEAARLLARLLPPAQAEVVLLRVLADLDVDEVAALTGRSPNWVRVNQHRALRRLAGVLGTRLDALR